MRILLLCALCCGWQNGASAQDKPSPSRNRIYALYSHVGGGHVWTQEKGNSVTAGITAVLRSGWGGGARYQYLQFVAARLPEDYVASTGGFNLMGSDDRRPREEAKIYSLVGLLKYRPFATQRFRLGAEAGLSWMEYAQAHFAPQPVISTGGLFSSASSNYAVSNTTRQTPGVALGLKFELPLGRAIGFEAGMWGNINRVRSLAGGEAALTLGLVRGRIPAKK